MIGTTIAIFLLSVSLALLGYAQMMYARRIRLLEAVLETMMVSNIQIMKQACEVKDLLNESQSKENEHGKEEPPHH